MSRKLSNISLREYRDFLLYVGCKKIPGKGGHEKWIRKDLNRPITVQAHISPVPEFIIKNGLRTLGMTKDEFIEIIQNKI